MASPLMAARHRITKDWQRCLPSMGIYEPLHLLRRVGPLLVGVVLDRDSRGVTYRPKFHVHNLGLKSRVIVLALVQPLRTKRTNAPDTISVASHEQRFEEAAARLSAQAPLPLAGPVSLNDIVAVSMRHLRRPGIHYDPHVYADVIALSSWAGDEAGAKRALEEAKQAMSDWPQQVQEQLGGVQHWLEEIESRALVPQVVRQTVDEEIARHRLRAVPTDAFIC